MRSLHRWTMIFALILLGYFSITGLLLQSSDTLAVVGHNGAEISAIRDGSAGPPGYIGMNPPDPAQTPLVSGSADGMLATALAAAPRLAIGTIELRRLGDVSQAVITTAGTAPQTVTIDTGAARILSSVPAMAPSPGAPGRATTWHDSIKTWHRGNIIGTGGVALNVLASLLLALLVITGVGIYLQMLARRSASGLRGLFWPGGGLFRRLHRLVAILASVFLLIMAGSGFLIGFDELMNSLQGMRMMGPQPLVPAPAIPPADLARALAQTEQLAGLTRPGLKLLAIKLRDQNGALQGIVWTDGVIPQPALFDLGIGQEITDPAAGQTNRPLGLPWKWHQIAKRIHRGDIIGLPGRVVDLLTGLSLLFLVISGGKIYLDLWLGRRALGRKSLFW